MRVFVYEHLCSGALAGQFGVESLRREGLAMLSAVLADLADCPNVEPLSLVEPDLIGLLPCRENHICSTESAETDFRRLAHGVDFTLVIAPEFDDILASRCQWALEEGSRLLGPTPEAVRLTGDKLALYNSLAGCLPTPHTASYLCASRSEFTYPVVWKPRFGAGSQFTALVRDCSERDAYFSWVRNAGGTVDPLIVQPYVPGRPASICFLAGPGQLLALPAAEQCLSTDGQFTYLGGRLPLAPPLQERARILGERAARTVPGLAGYFGVDLVLGAADDGRDDTLIEINPRLTTSYVGLRKLARGNLMQALLAVVSGQPPQPIEWRLEEVRFHADGQID